MEVAERKERKEELGGLKICATFNRATYFSHEELDCIYADCNQGSNLASPMIRMC